jgi:hypothetical protein
MGTRRVAIGDRFAGSRFGRNRKSPGSYRKHLSRRKLVSAVQLTPQ